MTSGEGSAVYSQSTTKDWFERTIDDSRTVSRSATERSDAPFSTDDLNEPREGRTTVVAVSTADIEFVDAEDLVSGADDETTRIRARWSRTLVVSLDDILGQPPPRMVSADPGPVPPALPDTAVDRPPAAHAVSQHGIQPTDERDWYMSRTKTGAWSVRWFEEGVSVIGSETGQTEQSTARRRFGSVVGRLRRNAIRLMAFHAAETESRSRATRLVTSVRRRPVSPPPRLARLADDTFGAGERGGGPNPSPWGGPATLARTDQSIVQRLGSHKHWVLGGLIGAVALSLWLAVWA